MDLEEMSFAELEALEACVNAELNSRYYAVDGASDEDFVSMNPLYYPVRA